MVKWLRGISFIAVLVMLGACGGGGGSTPQPPAPPTPTPPAPTIKLFALAVPSTAGVDCLVFTAAVSEPLQLLSVSVSHEIGTSFGLRTQNLGGGLILPSDRPDLQPEGECYPKVTGEYRFVFLATRPNDTTQLTINGTYNQVNAIRR